MSKSFYEEHYNEFLDLSKAPEEDALTDEEVKYYISENFEKYEGYSRGDIVFVKKFIYEDGNIGQNHLFVILDKSSYIPIEFFGMILSSNIKKETYKYNIKIKKDIENRLHKDSIIKTDHIYKLKESDILKKVGSLNEEILIKFEDKYHKYVKENKIGV